MEKDVEVVIGGRFVLGKKIGEGSFGQIYAGYCKNTNKQVALKLELVSQKSQQLLREAKIYKRLQGEPGIPTFYWAGVEGEFNVMVMDLLGLSLQDLLKAHQKPLPVPSVLLLADQIISRLECVHSKDYLHRDIKPENFLLGREENSHILYVIDFGLARQYRDNITGFHIPFGTHKGLVGTARYASINTHIGIEQSRRDDLESAGQTTVARMERHVKDSHPRDNSEEKA